MNRFLYVLTLVGILGILYPADAANIPLITGSVTIPAGQSKEFGFGTVPQVGTTVLLKIHSRINSKALGGSWMVMKLKVNGHALQGEKSRNVTRLVNKPLISPVSPAKSGAWNMEPQGWRVLYAPNFKAALGQSFYGGDPYTLVIDITDLTNPLAENRLEITNTATAAIAAHSSRDAALVIDSMEIETKPVPSPMMAASGVKTIVNRGEPAAGAAVYRGEIFPGGGFAINMGKSTFDFDSAFSYPNAGFNRLADVPDRSGQSNWQVKVDAKAGRVVAQGKDYRIVRTVHFGETHVEIADAITNIHPDKPLGMSIRHEMNLSEIKEPQVRVAGNPTQNDYYSPGNPSVHIIVPGGAVGIIAEDKVLRSQALLYTHESHGKEPEVAGIRTDMFCLKPGETYTLHWAVYPVAGSDYYDFVNLVREDWIANATVPGGVWWLGGPDPILRMSLPHIRESLRLNGIQYVMITGSWVDRKSYPKIPGKRTQFGFGTAVFEPHFADYRRRIREATEKLHAAAPGIKVLGYYDAKRDSSQNSPEEFKDSWLTGADGKQLSTDWGGTKFPTYNMSPTLDNSFGKAMVEDAKRYMDEMKLDGLYWDEMNNGFGPNEKPIIYNIFDGHSCILNSKTWTIERQVGLTTLVSLPFRLRVIDEIQNKGGVILGNGPFPNEEGLRTGILRMVESQHNNEIPHSGDLQIPYGFMQYNWHWDAFLRVFNLAKIPITTIPLDKKAGISKYPNDIMPYLFPFTPIELHAGYLLGKERIIVTHSGNYGWHGEKVLSLSRHFDDTGKLTSKHFPIIINDKEAKSDVQLSDNEATVLVRLPITFAPGTKVLLPAADAQVTVNQYDSNKILLNIKAPNGGILTVEDGEFAIKHGVEVRLNGKTQMLSVRNDQLEMQIPSGFNGSCELMSDAR